MKKVISILLVALMMLALFGCTQKTPEPTPTPEPEPTSDLAYPNAKIVITLPGTLGDKSFNDLMAVARDNLIATYPGITIDLFEAKSPADFEPNILAAANGGYDLVCVLAGQQREAAKNVVLQYPDKQFCTIDFVLYDDDHNTYPNVMSTLSAPNEGQFLVGAVCAMLTTYTELPNINEDKIVGWISGTETPGIYDFWLGFQQGVYYIDPDIQILQAYAGSYTDPIKGKELALAQYEQGADVIAQVASGTGLGIIEAAAEQEKYVIGVDNNQDDLAPGYVVTSMYKHVELAAFYLIETFIKGDFEGGSYKYMNVESGGVALTDFAVFKAHWGDKFPQEIMDRAQEIADKIASGEIVVDMHPGLRPWF